MSHMQFNAMLPWGVEAERMVADRLRAEGWTAVFEGGVWIKNGDVLLVEVKRKTQWVRFNGAIETGVDVGAHEVYEYVANRTGAQSIIVFVHEAPDDPGWWYLEVGEHAPRIWDGRGPDGTVWSPPLALWRREQLRAWPGR